MKTRLFLVCCAALALGSGCATYDSGGTADDTVVVTGSGDRYYYDAYPYHTVSGYDVDMLGGYRGDPVRETERGPAMWKQPSPNGQDWVDARPEFRWYRAR
jgi:hypothetical protein